MTHLIQWPGGEHEFVLRLGQLRALQKVCDAGPEEMLMRMLAARWRVDDVFETLRQGLIGGGMATTEASRLVTTLMDQHGADLKGMASFVAPAIRVLELALYGDAEEDADAGKPEAGGADRPASGASPASTETAP